MKFSKVLLGSAVLAAAAIGFMGCADDDDPNDMISGSNNNYTLEYTNDSTATSRGYNSTNLKHAGALVKVNFASTSDTQGGVMGMIFDLHDGEAGKDFAVVGTRTTTSGAAYYVSYYTGVTDLQGDNFGAPYTDSDGKTVNEGSTVTEDVITTAFTAVPSGCVDTTDGTTLYVYFVESSGKTGVNYYVYFLPKSVVETVDDVDSNGNLLTSEDSIIDIDDYYVATVPTDYEAITQNKFAVYANVYAGKTVKGTWELLQTYKAADVVED
ncbi:hypothetical protein [Treponema sp.]|jgi:hypothetical protein|uniref:hypothetical protein n=1 Tax=Treponema sp. TaxID=166 RepID=UPI0025803EBE|nr:hypothetical protein [Treponema sp.]MBE6355419.1 hypothetical protein [Treponema sp.]